MDIPVDGTQWGINSIQFIREKMLGSNAFYSINISPDGDLTNHILVVRTYINVYYIHFGPAWGPHTLPPKHIHTHSAS